MFQAGGVDYLATDAIDGANMDLDHVAFARLGKFDGRRPRRLSPAEIGQIAGRAGRHMSNGTFGTTADEGQLDPEIVSAVEEHRFDPLTRIAWRNPHLQFQSVGALLKSLDERPSSSVLVQTRDADDHLAVQALSRNAEVVASPYTPGRCSAALGRCARSPDFRKVMSDSHARFLAHCFLHLAGPGERLPSTWVAPKCATGSYRRRHRHADGADRTYPHLDLHHPSRRLARRRRGLARSGRAPSRTNCPTPCTNASPSALSIAARRSWCSKLAGDGGAHCWPQSTRPARSGSKAAMSAVSPGFGDPRYQRRCLGAHLDRRRQPRLRGEVASRAQCISRPMGRPALVYRAAFHGGARRSRLGTGDTVVTPRVEVQAGDFLEGEGARASARLQAFCATRSGAGWRRCLAARMPLDAAAAALSFSSSMRSDACRRTRLRRKCTGSMRRSRRALGRLGIRFDRKHLCRAVSANRGGAVPCAFMGVAARAAGPRDPHRPPRQGHRDRPRPSGLVLCRHRPAGDRRPGVASDRLEQFAAVLRNSTRSGELADENRLAAIAGIAVDDLHQVLRGLGYRSVGGHGDEVFLAKPRRRRGQSEPRTASRPGGEHHPFARLKELKLA